MPVMCLQRASVGGLGQHPEHAARVKKGAVTFEMWTPIRRWMPEHWMHRNVPRFHDAHDGRPTSLQSVR